MAYDRLRKFTEAIKDWDKAIELSPSAEQPALRAHVPHRGSKPVRWPRPWRRSPS